MPAFGSNIERYILFVELNDGKDPAWESNNVYASILCSNARAPVAQLVRASDQNLEDPGSNPGWISCLFSPSFNSANKMYPTCVFESWLSNHLVVMTPTILNCSAEGFPVDIPPIPPSSQVSTQLPYQSPSRRQLTRLWRCWQTWPPQSPLLTENRCSRVPPLLSTPRYRKSGNFHYMKFSLEKFWCWKIFIGSTACENILTRKFLQCNRLSHGTWT